MDRIECQWCQAQNEIGRPNCLTCGAPLDVKDLVTDSGWAEAPRLRDMTEFRFSNSVCQIEGEIVPVAEIALAPGDAVFFEHHVMLWKEPQVPMTALNTGGGMKRMLGGMPNILSVAHGPGRVAFSTSGRGQTGYAASSPARSACARPRTTVPSPVCSSDSISPCWWSLSSRSPRA